MPADVSSPSDHMSSTESDDEGRGAMSDASIHASIHVSYTWSFAQIHCEQYMRVDHGHDRLYKRWRTSAHSIS